LRILSSYLSIFEDGFLVHSAGLKINNNAFLFIGKSGKGKSTIIKSLLERYSPPNNTLSGSILSDELVIIKKGGKDFYAYGTPFSGEFFQIAKNYSAKTGKVFFLHKSPKSQIKSIKDSNKVINLLLQNVVCCSKDKNLIERLIANIHGFSRAVEFYEFHWNIRDKKSLDKLFE